MSIRRAILAATAAVLLAAGMAAAQEPARPSACLLTRDDAPLSELPVDLGGGLVAQHYFEGATAEIPDPFVIVTDCGTDAFLIAALPLLPGDTRRTADEVIGAVREAAAAESQVSGVDLAYRLTALGAPAQLRRSEAERCGCAAFYPDLRGDKTPWEDQ